MEQREPVTKRLRDLQNGDVFIVLETSPSDEVCQLRPGCYLALKMRRERELRVAELPSVNAVQFQVDSERVISLDLNRDPWSDLEIQVVRKMHSNWKGLTLPWAG